jgi:hypothetical protein
MPDNSSKSPQKETIADNDSSDSTKNSTDAPVDESKIQVTWKDVLPYFNAPMAFVIAAVVEYLGLNYFISVWVSFVLMPFVDSLLPIDNKNVSKEA